MTIWAYTDRMDIPRNDSPLSTSEEDALTERLRIYARGNQLHWGDEEAAALLIDRLKLSLAAERDRAEQAETKLAYSWEEARRSLTKAVRNAIKEQLVRPEKAVGTLSSMALVKNPYRSGS